MLPLLRFVVMLLRKGCVVPVSHPCIKLVQFNYQDENCHRVLLAEMLGNAWSLRKFSELKFKEKIAWEFRSFKKLTFLVCVLQDMAGLLWIYTRGKNWMHYSCDGRKRHFIHCPLLLSTRALYCNLKGIDLWEYTLFRLRLNTRLPKLLLQR